MFGVMLILYIPYLFVLLWLVWGHMSVEKQVGTWNLKCQASCALDPLLLPNESRLEGGWIGETWKLKLYPPTRSLD
jgi:hypothetical protein